MNEATKGTEILALEARRNEEQTRAEGALLGERRAAIARLAMIVMFAVIASAGGATSAAQMIVGLAYAAFAITTIVIVWRVKQARANRSRTRPLALAVVDFSLITTMSLLDQVHGHAFAPGRHAIATAILIAFTVARNGIYHVIAAVVDRKSVV